MTDPRRAPRVVLALGVLVGVTNAVGLAQFRPEQVGIATDVYYHAARTALAGGDVYAVAPPDHPGFRFLYPPVVLVVFLPFALLGPTAAYALWTLVNLLTGVALGVVLVRAIEREDESGVERSDESAVERSGEGAIDRGSDGTAGVALAPVDRALVVAYALGSAGATTTLVLGQVNLQLALGIALGALWLERGRETAAGVVFAGAAVVKLFPALVGAWLFRRRAWRTIAAATATGVALLLAGVALFGPATTVGYATGTLPREAAVGSFVDGPDPAAPYVTVRRQLTALAPWVPSRWLLPAALALLAPVVAAASRTVATYRDRLVALAATLLATLSVFPLEQFYLSLALFPTVPLLYLLDPGPDRRLFLVGALVASVPVTLPAVRRWIAAAPLPPDAAATLLEAVRAAFSFALPPTYGVWAMLAACVLYQHRAVRRREAASATNGSRE